METYVTWQSRPVFITSTVAVGAARGGGSENGRSVNVNWDTRLMLPIVYPIAPRFIGVGSFHPTRNAPLSRRTQSSVSEVPCCTFADGHYERQLEEWIAASPNLVGDLLLIGRQVQTDYGPIDLLTLDREGNAVVIELKRGQARREIIAQMNDYLRAVEQWDESTLQRTHNSRGASMEGEE